MWVITAGNPHSLTHRLGKVSVVEINMDYYKNDSKGLISAMLDIAKKRREHKRRLTEFLENIQPDIVISSGVLTKYFLPAIRLSSRPIFIRELHMDLHYNIQSAPTTLHRIIAYVGLWYEYWMMRLYDQVVLLTESEHRGVLRHWKKVTIIPNPITSTPAPPSQRTAKVAITGGRLVAMKNFDGLIRIWGRVVERHPDWTLQIWGLGEEEERLRQHIERLGLGQHVSLMGYTQEMSQQMSQASIMLLSSLSESFSLVTLEAMAVGLPTVVYNCPGGICHVVCDGKTGFLVPFLDEDTFTERVCQLIEDENLRHTMGQAALEESKHYSMDGIIQRWMNLFHELRDKR